MVSRGVGYWCFVSTVRASGSFQLAFVFPGITAIFAFSRGLDFLKCHAFFTSYSQLLAFEP